MRFILATALICIVLFAALAFGEEANIKQTASDKVSSEESLANAIKTALKNKLNCAAGEQECGGKCCADG